MKNLFVLGFRRRPKPGRTSHRTFRLPNAYKKVLADRLNSFPIAKVRAVIKVVKLSPERSNHLMLWEPVHVTK
jgi:hypothetical protein